MVLIGAAAVLGAAACGQAADTGADASGPATTRATAPVPPRGAGHGVAPFSTGTTGPASTVGPSPSTTAAPVATSPTTPAPPPPTTGGPTTVPPATGPATTHPTAVTTLALTDSGRPTVSRGRTVSPSRALPTTVYYPTGAGGPFPLIVFAHGFEIGPGPYAHLCQVLAAAGYVVAAPSFPLTDRGAAGGNLDRGDLPNQARDVSFVATAVAGAGGPLTGRVDGKRLGVVGHSDGADTALDIGYYPGRSDPRFRAVVAVAPDAMTGPGGSTGAAPLLLAQGDRDSVVPFSNSQTVWNQVHARRFYLVLQGADHLPPAQGAAPWAPVLERSTIAFLDRYVAGRATSDDTVVQAGSQPGVARTSTAG